MLLKWRHEATIRRCGRRASVDKVLSNYGVLLQRTLRRDHDGSVRCFRSAERERVLLDPLYNSVGLALTLVRDGAGVRFGRHEKQRRVSLHVEARRRIVRRRVHLGEHERLLAFESLRSLGVLRLQGLAVATPWRVKLDEHILRRVPDHLVEVVVGERGDGGLVDAVVVFGRCRRVAPRAGRELVGQKGAREAAQRLRAELGGVAAVVHLLVALLVDEADAHVVPQVARLEAKVAELRLEVADGRDRKRELARHARRHLAHPVQKVVGALGVALPVEVEEDDDHRELLRKVALLCGRSELPDEGLGARLQPTLQGAAADLGRGEAIALAIAVLLRDVAWRAVQEERALAHLKLRQNLRGSRVRETPFVL
mmetsp:Transcript_8772/g.18996  ORF Transcript_8772/g.18996 Transcript_8772/m.18996 type:complete len:369 (+) Transcript_8772:127-1233(+)